MAPGSAPPTSDRLHFDAFERAWIPRSTGSLPASPGALPSEGVFNVIDRNNDGVISKDEWLQAMQLKASASSQSQTMMAYGAPESQSVMTYGATLQTDAEGSISTMTSHVLPPTSRPYLMPTVIDATQPMLMSPMPLPLPATQRPLQSAPAVVTAAPTIQPVVLTPDVVSQIKQPPTIQYVTQQIPVVQERVKIVEREVPAPLPPQSPRISQEEIDSMIQKQLSTIYAVVDRKIGQAMDDMKDFVAVTLEGRVQEIGQNLEEWNVGLRQIRQQVLQMQQKLQMQEVKIQELLGTMVTQQHLFTLERDVRMLTEQFGEQSRLLQEVSGREGSDIDGVRRELNEYKAEVAQMMSQMQKHLKGHETDRHAHGHPRAQLEDESLFSSIGNMFQSTSRDGDLWKVELKDARNPFSRPTGFTGEFPTGTMHTIHITVMRADNLTHLNYLRDSLWCKCEVKTSTGAKMEIFRTQAKNSLNPEWNESWESRDWHVGDALEFTVYDAGALTSKVEGIVTLPTERFYPNGFEGTVPISGTSGTLTIRVAVPQTR